MLFQCFVAPWPNLEQILNVSKEILHSYVLCYQCHKKSCDVAIRLKTIPVMYDSLRS